MKIIGSIKLDPIVNEKLRELSAQRKQKGALVKTQQDIVASLIISAHKKEVK